MRPRSYGEIVIVMGKLPGVSYFGIVASAASVTEK